MTIRRASIEDADEWAAMRSALWSDADPADLRAELAPMLGSPDCVAFVAFAPDGRITGFAEAAIRNDYVNGCETSPAGFLEAVYVAPDHRGRGHARALIAAVETWVRGRGCGELASDALLDNSDSHRMHEALGFTETERVVYFRKILD